MFLWIVRKFIQVKIKMRILDKIKVTFSPDKRLKKEWLLQHSWTFCGREFVFQNFAKFLKSYLGLISSTLYLQLLRP